MKTRLIHSALFTAATVLMTACDDKPATPTSTPGGAETITEQPTQSAPEQLPHKPEDVLAAIAPQLSSYPWLSAAVTDTATEMATDGIAQLTAKIQLTVTEDLYRSESAPAAFNEERKLMNASANAAMQPNSLYLLLIGAPTESITKEDRKARPLPENLQQLANELKDLAETSVYTTTIKAGTVYDITATMKISTAEGGGYSYSDVAIQTENLPQADAGTPASALPEGAAVLTPEFEESRKQEIRSKIQAFDSAAAPYIKSREEEARTKWTEFNAAKAEADRKTAEEATAAAAEKEQWVNHCVNTIAAGNKFSGEWVRGSKFGKITLEIKEQHKYEDAVQFIGCVYDTELKDASMDVHGRCEFTKGEDGTSNVIITIYDGFYQEDKPTAEVYTENDGIMQLKFNAQGAMSGTMLRAAWKNQPEKVFNIFFSAPAKPEN